MDKKIREIWSSLESIRKISKEPFEFKDFPMEGMDENSVAIALNIDQKKTLLLKNDFISNNLPDLKCASLNISNVALTLDQKNEICIAIVCNDQKYDFIFSKVVSTIIDFLNEGSTPIKATSDSIDAFRQFLSRGGSLLPEPEKILGLTGELLFVEYLVKKNPHLWQGWRGPEKAPKDFSWGKIDVELKASNYSSEPSIKVSSMEQLRNIEGQKLFLWHSILWKDPNGNISVPFLVESILKEISDNEKFEKFLIKEGYLKEYRDLWLEYKFKLVEINCYSVTEDFPRINRDSFGKNKSIPDSIRKIKYEIDTNKLTSFKVDNENLIDLILKDV